MIDGLGNRVSAPATSIPLLAAGISIYAMPQNFYATSS